MEIELKFAIISNELVEASHIEINKNKQSASEIGTIKDRRLGEFSNILCETCKLTKNTGCNGHSGKIPLGDKILIHPSYINEIKNILNFFCYGCKRLKNEAKIYVMLQKNKKDAYKELKILNKCNNQFCNEMYGNFKFKDLKFYVKKGQDIECDNRILFEMLRSAKDTLKDLLGIENCHDAFIHTYMIAPSNIIRQPIFFDGQETNLLTTKYNKLVMDIFKKESDLQKSINDLDNDKSIKPYKKGNTKSITLADLSGEYNKKGILRNNILSSRGGNNARCVVSQGIDLNIGDVGLPVKIAEVLTDSIYFSRFSISRIKKALYENEVVYLIKKKTVNYCEKYQLFSFGKGKVKKIEKLSLVMNFGDFIEIYKQEGSHILRVRQPTLYKWNISSDRVIINKNGEDTLRTNTSSITARGEDYDGDEESLYNPQSKCTQFESSITMSSRAMIKNNSLGVLAYGLIQDQIIALHLLSKMEKLSQSEAILILGKYCCLIDEIQETYTGKELISLLFPKNIYIPGLIEHGLLIKHITSKEVTSSSSESIANFLTKLINEEFGINIIDAFSYISQKFLYHYGFSVTAKDVFLNLHEISDIQKKIQNWVNLYTDMINKYFKDIDDNKIQLLPEEYFEKIVFSNLYGIQRLVVNEIRNLFKNVKNNSIITMKDANFKINPGELMTIYGMLGQQGKTKSRHGIMGRSISQQLPRTQSPEIYGFITKGLLYGLSPDDYFNQIKDTSLPNIAAITFKTADTGHIGRKVVKFLESLVVNNHKQIETFSEILLPCVNHLKISGGDICKIEIIRPNSFNFLWKDKITETFDKLKRFMVINNGTSVIKTLDFFININEEIASFDKDSEDIIDNGLEMIYEFVRYIIKNYFFYCLDDTWITYCLLTHLDPNKLLTIGKKLNSNLINYIFNKIKFILETSISPGTPIGIEAATNLQENFTQQSLSSFHTTDKRGQQIKQLGFGEFKKYVEMIKNKYQTVTMISEDKSKLEKIMSQIEFVTLNDLNPKVTLEDRNDNKVTINIAVNKNLLAIKRITLYQFYQMIANFLSVKVLIENPKIIIKINKNEILAILYVQLLPNYEIKLNYLLEALRKDGINKGKLFNNNLQIDTTKIYDKDLNEKEAYELKIVVDNIILLSNFDTRNMIIDINDMTSVYELKGIQLAENDLVEKLLKTFGDSTNALYNSILLLAKMMCKDKKIYSIKKLKEKRKTIIKSAIHGDNNMFSYAALRSKVDKCEDLYSRILCGIHNNKGTKYFKLFVDPNRYDQLTLNKEPVKEIDLKSIKDLNFISSL